MALKLLISVCLLSEIYGCYTGWVPYQGKCYFFSHTTASWADAGSICAQLGSKLAEPKSRQEANFLKSHSQSLDKSFYLGISDLVEEGRWEYSSTHEPITFNLFHPGEPCCYLRENCLIMWEPFHGDWGDVTCSNPYYYVCEVEDGGSPSVIG